MNRVCESVSFVNNEPKGIQTVLRGVLSFVPEDLSGTDVVFSSKTWVHILVGPVLNETYVAETACRVRS